MSPVSITSSVHVSIFSLYTLFITWLQCMMTTALDSVAKKQEKETTPPTESKRQLRTVESAENRVDRLQRRRQLE